MWWGFKPRKRGWNFLIFLPHLLSTPFNLFTIIRIFSLSPFLTTHLLSQSKNKQQPHQLRPPNYVQKRAWRWSCAFKGRALEGLRKTHSQNPSCSSAPHFPVSLFRLRSRCNEGKPSHSFSFFRLFSLGFCLILFLIFRDFLILFLQHPDPIGSGLATDAVLEAAGPDCIVPGQSAPVKLLGLKVLFLLFHLFFVVTFVWFSWHYLNFQFLRFVFSNSACLHLGNWLC